MRQNEAQEAELIDIVSWGFGCGSLLPGVYVNVWMIRDWLLDNVPDLDFGKLLACCLYLSNSVLLIPRS